MTRIIATGSVEYIFGAGDSLYPGVSNGILMLRFVNMQENYPSGTQNVYEFREAD